MVVKLLTLLVVLLGSSLQQQLQEKIPQFMNDVYHVVADEQGHQKGDFADLGKTITCLYAQATRQPEPVENRTSHVWSFRSHERYTRVRRVELRVFRKLPAYKQRVRANNKFMLMNVSIATQDYFEYTAFMVSSEGVAWLSLDLTDLAKPILTRADASFDITLDMFPQKNQTKLTFVTNTTGETRALFIIYADDEPQENIFESFFKANMRRKKRDVPAEIEEESSESLVEVFSDEVSTEERRELKAARRRRSSDGAAARKKLRGEKKNCQVRPFRLRVSRYSQLDFIVGMELLDIKKCKGSCLAANDMLTLNAQLRTVVYNYKSARGRKVRKPCCAPVKFDPLILLTNTVNGTRIIHHKKGVVKECLCL